MAAQSKSAVSHSTSNSSITGIAQNLSPTDLLPFLTEVFKHARRSAAEVIEIGLRLLVLKEITPHVEWLPTLKRFGTSQRNSQKIMQVAIRFSILKHLVEACKSQGHLFELLALDDDDLFALDAGQTVHGLNTNMLGKLPVGGVRLALKGKKPGKSKGSAPTDGKSAGDDAFAPPPATGPVFGSPVVETGTSPNVDAYPAVYTLLPGEFNSLPISIIRHMGRTWLIAEEVTAMLGELSNDSPFGSFSQIIDFIFEKKAMATHRAKVRLASSILVMDILDQTAIRYLCEGVGTETAQQFSAWFESEKPPTGEPAKPMPIATTKPELTLDQTLSQLSAVNWEISQMMHLVEAQIKAVGAIVSEWQTGKEAYHIDPLVEIARKLIDPFDDLVERQDDVLSSLTQKLFKNPDAGTLLPESVWLALVTELADEHANGFGWIFRGVADVERCDRGKRNCDQSNRGKLHVVLLVYCWR